MNCTLSFESDAELEEHMLSGLHTVPKSLTSLDKVCNSFVHKMKITSQLNMPKRQITLHEHFSIARFSTLKRKGKLVEPTTENNENSQVNDNKEVYGENDDFNLTGDNEDDNKYEEDIANLAKEICLVWKVNDWVAVAYEKQWNIGYIVEVSITGIRVNCMINGQEKNTFRWPVTTEEINNRTDKIICLVNAPFLISGCGDYSLSEEDYNTVISLFLEKLTAAE
ncbi:uncharacterized protein LOC124817124 [Hydra vulgaris]|uniref:uncharacterized protein LOC124817124 n=1 Tax=Hydra vulgaris TaxID=6087 RepID=UPI000192446B|nr:uncharacterized protein LOC124817124 [Hydra vulgaris]